MKGFPGSTWYQPPHQSCRVFPLHLLWNPYHSCLVYSTCSYWGKKHVCMDTMKFFALGRLSIGDLRLSVWVPPVCSVKQIVPISGVGYLAPVTRCWLIAVNIDPNTIDHLAHSGCGKGNLYAVWSIGGRGNVTGDKCYTIIITAMIRIRPIIRTYVVNYHLLFFIDLYLLW